MILFVCPKTAHYGENVYSESCPADCSGIFLPRKWTSNCSLGNKYYTGALVPGFILQGRLAALKPFYPCRITGPQLLVLEQCRTESFQMGSLFGGLSKVTPSDTSLGCYQLDCYQCILKQAPTQSDESSV